MSMVIVKKDDLYNVTSEHEEIIIETTYQNRKNIANEFTAVSEDEDYNSNDELQGYYDEVGFAIDIRYELIIKLKGDWITGNVIDLIEKQLDKQNSLVIVVKNAMIKVLWEMPAWGNEGDIESLMYYFLEDGKLGEYSYYRVN